MSFQFRVGAAVCAAVLVSVAFVPQGLADERSPQRLTLEQAVVEALARSPVLRSRRAEVEQADGRLVTANTHPFNPEITLEANRRTNGDSTTDRSVKLGQEIEIGGQRRQRIAEASAELEASRARLLREERLLEARVHSAFVEVLRVRELLGVEQANVELARSLADVAGKRFASGAVAQMEVNLAQVQVGRAERDLRLAEGADEVARILLAETVGLDPSQPPELDGKLDLPPRQLPTLAALLETAGEHRADLQAFRDATEAARARIELSRSEAVPNLELEAFYGLEEGTDHLLGGGFTIGIPLFNRNQGRIAEAHAAHRQTLAQTEATKLQVRQEVAVALARYRAAHTASLNLQQQVLGTLQENLRLLQRSFEAGKTGWTEVLVFRREFVDVQREYIETLTDAWLAGIELDLASGVAPTVAHKESHP
jgi:cobalt-zinc-cadmium efflux system outer membrane protein